MYHLIYISLIFISSVSSIEWFANQTPTDDCPLAPRIRRSWTSLSSTEKSQYAQVVRLLKKEFITIRGDKPSQNYRPTLPAYDYFVTLHNTSPNSRDWHGTSYFLLAHRYFLYKYESALRWIARKYKDSIDPPLSKQEYCAFAAHYWNWEVDAELNTTDDYLPQNHSAIWEGGYLGTLPVNDPVAPAPLCLPHWTCIQNTSTCKTNVDCQKKGNVDASLKRNCSASVPFSYGPLQLLSLIVTKKSFKDYSLVDGPHSVIHRWLSYQMQSMASPDDPFFFLHHSNIDRLFAFWQDCHGYDNLRQRDLDSNKTLYEPFYGDESKFIDPKTNKSYSTYELNTKIPFYFPASRETYPIAQIPTPRQVWTMGFPDEKFDDMYFRYGPDLLIESAEACPDQTWTLVNQPLPEGVKRGGITYEDSFQKIMDDASKKIKDEMKGGKSAIEALEDAAYKECEATPKQDIDNNFLDWIKMNGAKVEQYDRPCDATSYRFYCKGIGRSLGNPRRCKNANFFLEEVQETSHESVGFVLSVVGIVVGSLALTIVIVFVAWKFLYSKGKEMDYYVMEK